jgi:hypothetical protein
MERNEIPLCGKLSEQAASHDFQIPLGHLNALNAAKFSGLRLAAEVKS